MRKARHSAPVTNHGEALRATLEARTVALVGASARPGSLGQRMVAEALRSPGFEQVQLVNPSYAEVAGPAAACPTSTPSTRPPTWCCSASETRASSSR